MINKLIEKYKGKIDHNNKLQKKLNTVGSYATDLYNDNEVCEEILQDLEELKEKIKADDIGIQETTNRT